MRPFVPLRTERLLLRAFRPEDRAPFAELNADPEVRRYFPGTLAKEESDAFATRIEQHFEAHGFGFFAVEVPGVSPFVGFSGLAIPSFEAPFLPAVEIGWRLARAHWGKGYASEAALGALDFAFDSLGLDEVVSFTVPANRKSRAVMDRIGMRHDPDRDFDHPNLPEGHALQRHVFYAITASDHRARRSPAPPPSVR